MSTLEKIKAEIQKVLDAEGNSENARAQALALFWVLEIIDKYAEQEPCDDAVSRQAVLNEFYDVENLYERIKQLPSVRPQEQTGHWIKKDGYSDCSECGSHIVTEWDYCPNCGCAMKGEL